MFERLQNLWSRDKRLGSGFKWMQFLASTHSHLVIAVLVLSDLESCDECLGLVVVLHLELVPAGQPAHHHQLLHRQLSRLRGGALLIACGPSIREIVHQCLCCVPIRIRIRLDQELFPGKDSAIMYLLRIRIQAKK